MKKNLYYTIIMAFAFVIVSCSKESADNAIEIPEAENAIEIEKELLGVVNLYRANLGQNSLTHSSVAYKYANEHTDYMIAKGNLSHDNFSSRASNISIEVNAEFVGENVAKDYSTAVEAFEKWLASPNHKKTIEGEFTHTAISVKKDSKGNLYFTQLFFR